jgi:hypothetical protein
MRANGLDPGIPQQTFVAFPAVEADGQRAEVLLHARARVGEEVLEPDSIRAVPLLGQELALDRVRKPARGGPFSGLRIRSVRKMRSNGSLELPPRASV